METSVSTERKSGLQSHAPPTGQTQRAGLVTGHGRSPESTKRASATERRCTPSCTNEDNFRLITELLNRCNVRFWIDQGTLLGAFRDGALLPWDHDIDLAIWEEEFPKITANTALFKSHGYAVQVFDKESSVQFKKAHLKEIDCVRYRRSEDSAVRTWQIREHRLPYGQSVLSGLASTRMSLARRRHGAGVGSYLWYTIARKCVSLCIELTGLLATRNRTVIANTPRHFFATFRRMTFLGTQVLAPEHCEAYLQFKYGPGWHIPQERWEYWTQDGAVAAKTQGPDADEPRRTSTS